MKARILGLVAVGLLAGPMAANAAPIQFMFSDTITLSGPLGGVADGDTLVVEVTADNGGSGFLSSQWFDSDIVSAVGRVGSYQVTFGAPFFGNSPAFAIDAGGALISNWYDTGGNNSDTAGGGNEPGFFGNALSTSTGVLMNYNGGMCFAETDCNGRWRWRGVFIPEPGTLALLGLGLAGLGLSRRRKAN